MPYYGNTVMGVQDIRWSVINERLTAISLTFQAVAAGGISGHIQTEQIS